MTERRNGQPPAVGTEIADELERRWIVLTMDHGGPWEGPSKYIEQGYFSGSGPRIRIIDNKRAVITKKTGKGKKRREHNREVDLETGRFLLETTADRLTKTRRLRDGWEVDYFSGPLTGLIVAEIEKPTLPELEAVSLPSWITSAVEVTHSVSNRHLARLATDVRDETLNRPIHDLLVSNLPGIVITGAPCSGKSSAMAALHRTFANVVHGVPETATIIIGQVGAKPPVNDRLAMKRFQRTMYRVQLGFEAVSRLQARLDGRSALLLDRGTMDNAAYMDHGVRDMESICRTTREDEYDRYHGVICLDVPPRDVYEAHMRNNPARTETYEEAVAISDRLLDAWHKHPQFRFIHNGTGWDDKLARITSSLEDLLSSAGAR